MAYSQDWVNQLVQEAAAAAGGTLSYEDAVRAASSLGIPASQIDAALSTGVISAPTSFLPGASFLPGVEERIVDMGEGTRSEFFVRGTDIPVDAPTYTERWDLAPMTESSMGPLVQNDYVVYDDQAGGEFVYSPTGEYKGFIPGERRSGLGGFLTETGQQLAPIIAMAAAPGLSSAFASLFPSLSQAAVAGLTGATTAGGGTLLSGGSFEDALRNAALAGGLSYGGASLFGGEGATGSTQITDRQMAIADAKQLADAGISQSQISNILSASGYPEAIVTRALDAISTSSTVGSRAPTITAPSGGVEIVGTAPINIPSLVGGATGGLLSTPPSTNVEIVSNRPTPGVIEGGLGGLLSGGGITTPSVTAPSTTVPDNVVEVVADRPTRPPVAPIMQTPTPSPITTSPIDIPEIKADNKTNISTSDLLKIFSSLGLLGGAAGVGGGAGQGGPFVAPTQGVPKYSDDYYQAIQRYYNAYLPQMPRDVATPLQQWYESKYGG